jgi:two-component system OmpR family sensor kinase
VTVSATAPNLAPGGSGGVLPGLDTAPVTGRGTLRRRLVLQMVALVALVAIVLSALTTLVVRELLVNQIDQQLSGVAGRGRSDPGRGGPPDRLNRPGQPIGTLVAVFLDSGERGGAVLREGGQTDQLPDPVLDQVATTPTGQAEQITASLGALGRYRLQATRYSNGTVVVGLPMDAVDRVIAGLVGIEAILTGLAMAGAALAGRALIGRSLRPLNRVAAAAQQVSQLELDRGEVALAVRVPPADADPTSEVGQVGQAFNHMLNNVEEALAARQASETRVRQFVADASHELRNPLAAIRGYAELTRRVREEVPPDAAYAMSRVESEAGRMASLVEDLLLLARLDSGPDLDLQPTDVTEVVMNAVNDARVAGPEHIWRLAVPELPVVAPVDRHRLHQVVTNLLANARTHTPPGTQVEAGVRVADGAAVITVTDHGPGIPPEIADRVFERFTRADVSRVRTPGAATGGSTGLGLAIVAAVVEAHHGRVEVHSEPGYTCFAVTLPLAAPSTP